MTGEETDLVDTAEADGEEEGVAATAETAAPATTAIQRMVGESAIDFGKRVFGAVFEQDVRRCVCMPCPPVLTVANPV